jgi:hypothetical protein
MKDVVDQVVELDELMEIKIPVNFHPAQSKFLQ